jgi:GTPase SAR1 family protein
MTNLKLSSEMACTVVVVGDSRVGKTALIQRFVQKTFQQVSHPFKLLFL